MAIRQLSTQITNIDGTIKLFDLDYDLRTIKAKAPRHTDIWFEHGQAGGMVLDTLRASIAPLSTCQAGEAMIAVKGVTVTGAQERDSVLKPVLGALQRLERKCVIKMVGYLPGPNNDCCFNG